MFRQETSKLKNKNSKVFIGLSGGVDSSVSAALLKEQDYDVTGVFIKVWQPDWIECTWKEDRLDAMRVCAKLGIPFVTLDLSKEYKREVVDYMIEEYRVGRTPNPDVMCNRYVKFGGFYDWAMRQGADYVATGHYARVGYRVEGIGFSKKIKNRKNYTLDTNPYTLLAGSDPHKDQSYFLWTLKREQLAHTLFPVGHLEKPDVRKLAKKFGLSTAEKKDSQGLCFLGKIDVKEFLKQFIKPKKGKVLNEDGEVIGSHDGAMFFTLGERHGFRASRLDLKSGKRSDLGPNAKPYYVVAKDVKKNTLTVSHNPTASIGEDSRKFFEIKDANWITRVPPYGTRVLARLRYRQPLQMVRIRNQESRILIEFDEAQIGGAPGQSVVFYESDVCLGGGTIK
ncbi:MAG: tRNA 2-thiouridine(34) synthase MnmA [Candidatus Taylorbacteria bacterium]|nr:tRNA 2-thiouridine(34) synthase MnmA [Candidatus Taylorbacteria bacterium]